MTHEEFIEKFKRSMIEHGITPPLELIADGQHHHFKTDNGDKAFYGISAGLTKHDGAFWRGWSGNFGTGDTLVSIQTPVKFNEAGELLSC